MTRKSAADAPLILTPGEPGGIGHEITIKAWHALRHDRQCSFALLTDVHWLKCIISTCSLDCPIEVISTLAETERIFPSALPVLNRPLPSPAELGTFDARNASWVISAIAEAVQLCIAGTARAMTTNPIQKESLYSVGFDHEGHTDFLAALAKQHGHSAAAVMMLVGGGIRAVPVTVHIPLRDVPKKLHSQSIMEQARIVHDALMAYFNIFQPRLAIAGLNPHAGENGTIGREERDIIAPAIARLRDEGLNIIGPLPADTAFSAEMRKTYDAILCMYHDQALIPVKALDFHGGVNVTLGLPFLRTSPDHGTALAIAGKGKAMPDSLIAAIRLAVQMTSHTAGP